ncbi:MAG: NapC/NirT family cytochrome c, partial [Candidatus Thiodiazotropha endolucinida]
MFRQRAGYRSAGKISIILAGIIFVGGIIFSGLFSMGLAFTNEMDFCTSCHSMKIN